jgi:hypothetical protein
MYEVRASGMWGLEGFELELELGNEKAEANDGTCECSFILTMYGLICVGRSIRGSDEDYRLKF